MRVVCYGDSNTWGYDPRNWLSGRYEAPDRWADILAEKTGWQIENRGLNGRCIPKTPVTLSQETDLLIVMLGTNDILQGASPEDAALMMREFLSRFTQTRIVLIAPPAFTPGDWVQERALIERSSALADLYRDIALEMKLGFCDASKWNIPLAYDGVHFTEAGHQLFAQQLYDYLRKGESLCWKLE